MVARNWCYLSGDKARRVNQEPFSSRLSSDPLPRITQFGLCAMDWQHPFKSAIEKFKSGDMDESLRLLDQV
jgi:hypothetical protein